MCSKGRYAHLLLIAQSQFWSWLDPATATQVTFGTTMFGTI